MSKSAEEMANEVNETLAGLKNEIKEIKEKKTATPEEVKAAEDALEAYKSEVSKNIEDLVSAKDFEEAKKEIEDFKKSLEDQKKTNDELHLEITTLKDSKTGRTMERVKFQKEVLAGIRKSLDDKDNRPFSFEVKAAAFASTAVTDNNNYLREAGIDKIAHRKISLLDIFKRVPLPKDHGGTVSWREWDEATTSAVVTAIEEGNAFPESTVKWKTNEEKVKKIGTSIPVSEEFGVDESTLYNEIEDFFRDYVELFEEEQIYKGDNTTGQLNGFYNRAPVYVPAAKAFVSANIYDVALDVQENIERGKESKFIADTMLLNKGTVNTLRRTKNDTKDYLDVPFAENKAGQMTIAGMLVVETNLVEDDEMVVFDSRRATIFEYEEYEMTTAHVANQFLEDEKTLKARKRMMLRIKSNDLPGFRKVTSISAAITALETVPTP